MENKYYTPTIEEFHVGFEYEENALLGYIGDENIEVREWITTKIETAVHMYDVILRMERGENIFRVKHLDRKDIESLGLESTKPLWYQYHNDRYMIVDLSNKGDNMYSITDKRYDMYLFYGTIKNKSELKKVLKMIGCEKG